VDARIVAATVTASGPPAHLRHPPAQADEEKPPILQKLRRLTLDRMTDELEGPSDDEHRQRDLPHAADEQRDDKQRQ